MRKMKPVAVLFMVALMLLTFSSCGRMGKEMQPNMENSDNPQTVETQDIGNVGDINGAEGTEKMNNYDFSVFNNVEISGIDVDSLDIEERSVLYRQAEYCQAMTDADIDKMREIVSENMTFERYATDPGRIFCRYCGRKPQLFHHRNCWPGDKSNRRYCNDYLYSCFERQCIRCEGNLPHEGYTSL